jgi:hypothetical protein
MDRDDLLVGYTVFDRPRDWPGVPFLVRPWCVPPEHVTPAWPFVRPSGDVVGVFYHQVVCLCASLEEARAPLIHHGLTRLNRAPDDDAVIVEVWL